MIQTLIFPDYIYRPFSVYSISKEMGGIYDGGDYFNTEAEARAFIARQSQDRRWFIVDERRWRPTEVIPEGQQLSLF